MHIQTGTWLSWTLIATVIAAQVESGAWLPWTLIMTFMAFVWKASSDYQKLKDLAEKQKELPTKMDMVKMESQLKEFLRTNFLSVVDFRREIDNVWQQMDRRKEDRHQRDDRRA